MYTFTKNYFSEIDSFDKAYWLGFIAADGNIRKDLLKLRIEIHIKDISHLIKFRQDINGNMPIKTVEKEKHNSCYLDVNCKNLCKDLGKFGIVPNKSLILNINWDKIPDELIKYVIRGYFDGDGSLNLYTARGYNEWELSFIGTQNTLNFIMEKLDISKTIYTCGRAFRIAIKAKKEIYKSLRYFYNDDLIFLDRKFQKVLNFFALNDYQMIPSNG